jgi:hypothetical protein
MPDLEWIVNLLPQGAAVSAVVSVVALILLKYVPTLIASFKEIIHAERELFRSEMKELRTTFAEGMEKVTKAFTDRDRVLSDRIDGLTEAHRDLSHEVMSLKDRLED